MRKGWNPELDCPKVAVFYKSAVPSKGEYQEPEYIEHVNNAVNALPVLHKNLVEGHYRYQVKLKPLAAHFEISYTACREKIKVAEGYVYGHLKAIGLIRG